MEDIMSIERTFVVGEFGIEKNCVGIGTGGGFSQKYNDLILFADGKLDAISFMLPSSPGDFQRRPLGQLNGSFYESFSTSLKCFSFFETEPDRSSTLASYVFAIKRDGQVHSVTWPFDSIPAQNPDLDMLHVLLRGAALFLHSGSPSVDEIS